MARERRGTVRGFAERLDELILGKNFSYTYVAERIGRDRKSVYAYKDGTVVPDGLVILKLCYLLGTTPNYLLLGKE